MIYVKNIYFHLGIIGYTKVRSEVFGLSCEFAGGLVRALTIDQKTGCDS